MSVSYGCCNKTPKLIGFKQNKYCLSQLRGQVSNVFSEDSNEETYPTSLNFLKFISFSFMVIIVFPASVSLGLGLKSCTTMTQVGRYIKSYEGESCLSCFSTQKQVEVYRTRICALVESQTLTLLSVIYSVQCLKIPSMAVCHRTTEIQSVTTYVPYPILVECDLEARWRNLGVGWKGVRMVKT